MQTTFCAALLLIGGLASSTLSAAELVMTAPRAPVAGHASTLIFSAPALGYDLDPATQPVATIAGSTIRIDLNAECDQIFCDVISDAMFRIDLPALDEGRYDVVVYRAVRSSDSIGRFDYVVGPAAELPSRRPADGAWSDQSRPGTGLHVQHRGPVVAVTQFDFQQERPSWRLDAATLRGDSVLLLMRNYEDGSCFGCEPYVAPSFKLGGTPLLITFESARRARAELADGTLVPLVSLPFGADYVPVAMADAADVEFGPLPLPDLSGTWAFGSLVQTFGPAQILDAEQVLFPPVGNSQYELLCRPGADQETKCWLTNKRPPILGPVPAIGIAALGDVEENRIRMVSNQPAITDDFYMVRIPSIE